MVATRQARIEPADLLGKGLVEVLSGRGWLRLVVATVALIVVPPTGDAVADGKVVPLGGGAGILVGANRCTLTTIGYEGAGELVGFTVARCGGPGTEVVAEGTDTTVGTVVAAKGDIANGDLGYAVIKFDSAKVIPLANFRGFAINGMGPTPNTASQPASKALPQGLRAVPSPVQL